MKRIIATIEFITDESERQRPLGSENVIVVPQGDNYCFYYFDNRQAERLVIKNIEMVSVKAILVSEEEKE